MDMKSYALKYFKIEKEMRNIKKLSDIDRRCRKNSGKTVFNSILINKNIFSGYELLKTVPNSLNIDIKAIIIKNILTINSILDFKRTNSLIIFLIIRAR